MASNRIEVGKMFLEDGLPGFSHLQFFQLIQEESGSPFYVLQSLEDEQVQFWMAEPFVFFRDYEFTLNEKVKSGLHIQEEAQVAVLNIVTMRSDGQVTVNLKAPIIINLSNRMAKQVILNDEKFNVRQPLLQIQAQAANE